MRAWQAVQAGALWPDSRSRMVRGPAPGFSSGKLASTSGGGAGILVAEQHLAHELAPAGGRGGGLVGVDGEERGVPQQAQPQPVGGQVDAREAVARRGQSVQLPQLPVDEGEGRIEHPPVVAVGGRARSPRAGGGSPRAWRGRWCGWPWGSWRGSARGRRAHRGASARKRSCARPPGRGARRAAARPPGGARPAGRGRRCGRRRGGRRRACCSRGKTRAGRRAPSRRTPAARPPPRGGRSRPGRGSAETAAGPPPRSRAPSRSRRASSPPGGDGGVAGDLLALERPAPGAPAEVGDEACARRPRRRRAGGQVTSRPRRAGSAKTWVPMLWPRSRTSRPRWPTRWSATSRWRRSR